jgi:predicted Ser/Thr protein kinase
MITFKDFLNESPLPDTWDKDKFKQRPAIKTFRDIIEYASEKAAEVGRGSSRVAFKIDYKNQDTVLKIAKNEKGLSQNKQEIGYLSDDFIKNLNITIPMIDYDTDNVKPKWIHTELADKAEEKDFIN